MQIDFDDEVEHEAVQKIYDLARDPDDRPFFLTVSFTHPHSPYLISEKYWDMYEDVEIDMPTVPTIEYDDLDPFSQARYVAMGHPYYTITDDQIRTARRAYYGMVSYIDDKVGAVLDTLREAKLADNTIIIFASDHGEMLGERGMWLKDTFFEWSVRVPLFVAGPRISPGRVSHNVSLVDLTPTILELAGKDTEPVDPFDGDSFVPLLEGNTDGWKDEAISEYAATGHQAPSRMIRKGDYKYWVSGGLAPMLFNLADDPDELENLAGRSEVEEVERDLHARMMSGWDPEFVEKSCRLSQQRRLLLRDLTEKTEKYSNWSAQVSRDDANRYVRGRASSFYAKARMRFPFVEEIPPDHDPDLESF